MRSGAPRDLLLHALGLQPRLSRLEMHAFLHRLCGSRAIDLQNWLREPMWRRWAESLRIELDSLSRPKDWSERLSRRISDLDEGAQEQAVVAAATLLQCLDRYHHQRVRDVGAATASLPPELGGGMTLFLPPPESPIAALVPEPLRLGRSRADLKSDLREVLELWWHLVSLDRHAVQPRISALDALIARELNRRLVRQGDLRFGLASPFASLRYIVRSDPSRCGKRGTPYRFAEMSPESLEPARADLESILHACAQHRIDVLCFPELTLDTSLFHHLRLLLQLQNPTRHPLLVITGSFHLEGEDGWVNRCRTLGGSGAPVSTQDKCAAYSLPGIQVTPHLAQTLGIDERGGYEDITQSSVLEILETPLGRLATPICLDFCGEQLRDLLVDSCVNLFFVPAMTPRMEPFLQRARDLGTQNRAVTFAVNSAWLLGQTGAAPNLQELVLAYLPARKLKDSAVRQLSAGLYSCSIRELLGTS